MMISEQLNGVYLGSRGDNFKQLITGLLETGKLKRKYIRVLTDEESMSIYGAAFTSELVDEANNYQVLEQLGDLSGNKFIVDYMYTRFPQLDCTEGVKVVARLRINYGAKQSFSEIARKLGFWNYISATNDLRQRKMKPLLEDVFEAFIGATERILNRRIRPGVGYAIVYDILASIFDKMDISLRYEDLYDAKTRLKELFDMHEEGLGPLIYKDEKNDMVTTSTLYRVDGAKYKENRDRMGNFLSFNKKIIVSGNYIKIGTGFAALKADAQQNGAQEALKTLNSQGWIKPVPRCYQHFDQNHEQKKYEYTESDMKIKWGLGKEFTIDSLQSTKDKSKYQSKYQSTILAYYCRIRDTDGIDTCMAMGSNPNIADSDGLSPLDLLFVGKVDESLVKTLMKKLLKHGHDLKMQKPIYNMYYTSYVRSYFTKHSEKIQLI